MNVTREKTDSERVDEQYELLTLLEKAMRSRRYTVQCMPHGCEIIEVATADTVKTIVLTEVESDA